MALPASGTPGDPMIQALEELSEVVDETTRDNRKLASEIEDVREQRLRGATVREALSGARRPRLTAIVNRMSVRLSSASGSLRRALVVNLLDEGERVGTIARLLQVSHQRISTVLRRRPV